MRLNGMTERITTMQRYAALLVAVLLLAAACGAESGEENAPDTTPNPPAASEDVGEAPPSSGTENPAFSSGPPADPSDETSSNQPGELDEPESPPSIAPPADEPVEPPPAEEAPVPQPGYPSVVLQAIEDLADRTGRNAADIVVVRHEEVEWRDGSLGCPEPGGAYTQAIVPDGYRIILEVDGRQYAYHGRGDNAPFYCAKPAVSPPSADA